MNRIFSNQQEVHLQRHIIFASALLIFVISFSLKALDGPLRPHPDNGRYFTDNSGRAILLTGSHTWENFQDIGLQGEEPFDWHGYLNMLTENNHNFIRLWVWEQAARASWTEDEIFFDPLPFLRIGPSVANDGKPKFDLDKWNQAYFDRLRQRVQDAGKRGIYVSVMLFQGWSLNKAGSKKGDPWPYHPFNKANNLQGVHVGFEADQDFDDKPTLHNLGNPEILVYQEAYVKKVIDTVNDLDNVLYEILNEGGAKEWTYHMIDFIHDYEKHRGKQHPVGMTHPITPKTFNIELLKSPAEWVSFANEPLDWQYPGSTHLQNYQDNPHPTDGDKVSILDTDHLWGHGGNAVWAWKSFMRGHNPVFMDPWQPLAGNLNPDNAAWIFLAGGFCKDDRDYPDWAPLRRALGQVRRYADKVDLAAMIPCGEPASTGYCLANAGQEYLIYFPHGGTATLNLIHAEGDFFAEWFIPSLERTVHGPQTLKGGDYIVVTAPFTGDAVLYLKKK